MIFLAFLSKFIEALYFIFLVFDELNDPKWSGETIALLKSLNIKNVKLRRFPFEPHLTYIYINEKK